MITTQARGGFEQLFKSAIRANLGAAPEDTFEIEEFSDTKKIKEKEVLILTISTYFFRVIAFFYFSVNDATKDHFARKNRLQEKGLDDGAFYDAFAEFGNICCGQLNRELGHYFPHLGMSTPNVLETECLGYMSSLNGKHVQHFKVVINDSITFYAALCVCNDDTIDFAVRAVEPDTSTGELELF